MKKEQIEAETKFEKLMKESYKTQKKLNDQATRARLDYMIVGEKNVNDLIQRSITEAKLKMHMTFLGYLDYLINKTESVNWDDIKNVVINQISNINIDMDFNSFYDLINSNLEELLNSIEDVGADRKLSPAYVHGYCDYSFADPDAMLNIYLRYWLLAYCHEMENDEALLDEKERCEGIIHLNLLRQRTRNEESQN